MSENTSDTTRTGSSNFGSRNEEGLALVLVMFILAVLTGMGVALLLTADVDSDMTLTDRRAKQVFYIAEAGLEDGRERVRALNEVSTNKVSLSDELAAAAGGNGVFDFNVATLAPVYDSAGNVTGFTGYGDDVPLRAYTAFGRGWYGAFLQNDPADANTPLTDTNDLVLVTAIGAGTERSIEVVQAIVEKTELQFPAGITMLGQGPTAAFDGGNSNAKTYIGDDCSPAWGGYTGIPGHHVPTVGTDGATAEAMAEAGVNKPLNFISGGQTGTATVQDVSSSLDPIYSSCTDLVALGAQMKSLADYVCTPSTPCSHWATSTIDTITFVEGNLSLSVNGKGILWVTGDYTSGGNPNWEGIIFVVGKGRFYRTGGGNGKTYGATVTANVAGADGALFTADDCTGPYSGFGVSVYDVSGGGTHDLVYCTDAIEKSMTKLPMKIVDFRQR